MAEYIDRNKAIETVKFYDGDPNGLPWAVRSLKVIPAADVAPVVHGEWIESDLDKDCVTCSNCKRLKLNDRYAFTKLAFEDWGLKFCPNCGARMDLKEADNAV